LRGADLKFSVHATAAVSTSVAYGPPPMGLRDDETIVIATVRSVISEIIPSEMTQ
jgi:hypothetical protein